MVNLVDKQGYQKRLGEEFQRVLQASKFKGVIDYTWFDYHAQCKGMKVENCQKLMKSIQKQTDAFGWMEGVFEKGELTVLRRQKGVVRTNCIDCLDRSNVLQSMLARHNLLSILKERGLSSSENIYLSDLPSGLEMVFRRTWVAHGNTLSILYAGTPALKTDFTLLGKRTVKGVLADAKNGITRFNLNLLNF